MGETVARVEKAIATSILCEFGPNGGHVLSIVMAELEQDLSNFDAEFEVGRRSVSALFVLEFISFFSSFA